MTILTVANEFKYENGKGANDFSTHSYKLILMASGFTFDKDAHGTYADVSASEISANGGYTVGGQVLTVDVAWAQDNANDKGAIAWNDVSFTASGAAFDDFCAAIIINDSHAGDLIVGCVDFETDLSVPDGLTFQIQNLGFESI